MILEASCYEDYRHKRKDAKTIRGNEPKEGKQRRMDLYVFLGCEPEGSGSYIQGLKASQGSIHGLQIRKNKGKEIMPYLLTS